MAKYKPTEFMAEDSRYDKKAADYAVSFIECLSHTKGTWAGKNFELLDWQEQIIRDLFGILKPNGYRQFNTAYIEIPKKNGKSELAAAVALLLTCGDGEERAEVYGCAADRQQAAIVFDVAADMVRMCPALNKRVKILTSQKRIVYIPTNSFYQVLSAEAYSKHGFNIHGVVFDELHTQPNRKLFDVMTKGSGDARMQPLYFLITTAGTDTKIRAYKPDSLIIQPPRCPNSIYNDLSDPSRADLTEILFGKNRANQGIAILQAFQSGQIEKAYEAAENSFGSATAEYDKMSEGIEAHINDLHEAWEKLSNDFINSDFLKTAIDFGTKLIDILDALIQKVGAFPAITGAIAGGLSFKGVGRPKTEYA